MTDKTLTQQIFDELDPFYQDMLVAGETWNQDDNIVIVQTDASTVWCRVFLNGGKQEEKLTASLTPTGKIKKGSINRYDYNDNPTQ